MEKIIYTYPYPILFGHINIEQPKYKANKDQYPNKQNIDDMFYEGFKK